MALKDEFTEIGYPKDNKQIGDHMKAMVELGRRHPHIQEMEKKLDALADLIAKTNGEEKTKSPEADSPRCPRCNFKLD